MRRKSRARPCFVPYCEYGEMGQALGSRQTGCIEHLALCHLQQAIARAIKRESAAGPFSCLYAEAAHVMETLLQHVSGVSGIAELFDGILRRNAIGSGIGTQQNDDGHGNVERHEDGKRCRCRTVRGAGGVYTVEDALA